MPGNQAAAETQKDEAATALLSAENAHLLERIKQLEQERERDRQTLAALQAERDAYRRAVYAGMLERITDEDLQRYAQHEEGLPLDDFIGELENHANASRDA